MAAHSVISSVEGGLWGRRWWLRNGGRRNGGAFLKALSFGFVLSLCDVHFFPFFHLASPAGEGLGNINL